MKRAKISNGIECQWHLKDMCVCFIDSSCLITFLEFFHFFRQYSARSTPTIKTR